MTTTFGPSAFAELDQFTTPNFDAAGEWNYQDADDELKPIASFIASKSPHNSDVDPSRIKFLYTMKVKKEGGRFGVGSLSMRSDIERLVNDEYDYIVTVYFPVWKDLDSKNKVIQLDKVLCGVLLAPGKDTAEVVVKKNPVDSREYLECIKHFGADDVLKSSNLVDLAVQGIMEKAAEDKKLQKELNKKPKKEKR